MPGTSSDSKAQDKSPGESCTCPPLPSPPSPWPRDVESPLASGSQLSSMDGRQKQQRPSVLRKVVPASRHQHAVATGDEGEDTGHPSLTSSLHMASIYQPSSHIIPLMPDGPNQSSIEARLQDGVTEGSRDPFPSGFCRWPGCNAMFKDDASFIKHLHSEHSHCDRSLAQWRVQQDIVQQMESQLILEKQKLVAMQLYLHLTEHKYTDLKAASDWPHSLPLFSPQPQVRDGDQVQQWWIKQLEEFSQHSSRATAASANLLTVADVIPSIEFYKYKNIRPPYTYAYLIRRSIMESPDKQRTLNEIYNWFTTMFCYFRHNTATWKNAVRHNLSLHKCFVRVEGGKGAVWTVDETEYQRRKGQKYHRDGPVKWLTSYSQYYCPEEA